MKKKKGILLLLFITIFLCVLCLIEYALLCKSREQNRKLQSDEIQQIRKAANVPKQDVSEDGVKAHGKLTVKGINLIDEKGNKVQLRGMSSHGLLWYPEYTNYSSICETKKWGANMFRIAMYSDDGNGDGGYIQNPELSWKLMQAAIENTLAADMYALVDWHMLGEQNPLNNVEKAKEFFSEVSALYGKKNGIIYEICNEPNGGTTWQDVKSYAEEIIPIIRNNAPDAVIIVGTPTWCQDVDVAAKDPITDYDNIMYAIHFYAATHTDNIRSKAREARDSGLPIIVSEFSICDASGNGAIDYNQAEQWFDLIDEYNLSYAAWNVSNKAETSSLIQSSCTKTSGWTVDDLSDTGKWIRLKMRGE